MSPEHSISDRVDSKRPFVALLYFYIATLIGLAFLLTGVSMILFGIKDVAAPSLGVTRQEYEYRVFDASADGSSTDPSEAELEEAKEDHIEDRRAEGADKLVSGIIVVLIGAPVFWFHLRAARRHSD